MKLFLCGTCNRHVKEDTACPFCGSEHRSLVGDSTVLGRRVARTVLTSVGVGAAMALAITGCSSNSLYGCSAPPPECPSYKDAIAPLPKDAGGDGAEDAADSMPDAFADAGVDATDGSAAADAGDAD